MMTKRNVVTTPSLRPNTFFENEQTDLLHFLLLLLKLVALLHLKIFRIGSRPFFSLSLNREERQTGTSGTKQGRGVVENE